MTCYDPELRYLLRTPAGAEYIDQINAQASDRRTRAAFRDLVLSIAPPRAMLFDFGAGPGIDARFFAEHGFTIDAYDVDPRMREFFGDHCRDLIDSGQVTLHSCTYREFLTRAASDHGRRADLVISNFAPLNLVDNLHELFARFHALTGPEGKIFASVLNPWYISDMRSRLWWRDATRLWRDGEVFFPGPQAPHYRRLLRKFRTASAPHFQVSRIFLGLPSALGRPWGGVDPPRHTRFAWLHAARSRYLFLLFEKAACR